jgi:peptidoglycan/xylan/chitin deacetylase (PgdA/CDA1 family)
VAFDLTLTFDNGPTDATPAVLDLLAEHGAKATFFVLGRHMADPRRRALAERAAAEGHWIGNHTYSHSISLGDFTEAAAAIEEIAATQALIGELSPSPPLFRPYANSGVLDRRVLHRGAVDFLVDNHFSLVLWNVLPGDWLDAGWVERAIEQCTRHSWNVIVLHDAYDRVLPGLERFLPLVSEAGARFRQDFPDDCVPIRGGQVHGQLDALVAA